MNSKMNSFFACVRKIIAPGIVCMLLFAVVSCESAKEPYADDDFDLSELNEENCHPELGWAVELRLEYGITDCPTENPKIKALEVEHNVTLKPSFPGTSNTVLMRYFTLIGEDCSNLCYARTAIRAFLTTGLFENHVRVFGIAYTTN